MVAAYISAIRQRRGNRAGRLEEPVDEGSMQSIVTGGML